MSGRARECTKRARDPMSFLRGVGFGVGVGVGVSVDVAMLAARPSSVAGKMDRPLDRQTYFNFIRECPRHFLVRRKCQGVMKNLPCNDEAFPLPISLSLERCYSSGCSDSRVYVTAVPHNNVARRFNRRRLLFFTPQPPPLSPFRWTLLSAGRRNSCHAASRHYS